MTGAILKISANRNLELRYTARRAEKLESLLDDGLLEGLRGISRIGTLAQYIACGADITKEEALDAYDEYIDNGGDINGAAEVIVQALYNGGFISQGASDAAQKMIDQLNRRAARLNGSDGLRTLRWTAARIPRDSRS